MRFTIQHLLLLGVALSWADLARACDVMLSLTSAAADASILLNGAPVMDCARGVNVAAFAGDDPGQLLAAESFDTYGDQAAADQLLQFVGDLQDGTIVAIVVEDDASVQFSSAQREQLAGLIGATQIQALQFRSTYAFAGTKATASAPGPFQEALDTGTITLEQCLTSGGSPGPTPSPSTPAPAPAPSLMKFELAFQVIGLQTGCQEDCRQVFSDAILSFINDSAPKNVTSGILQIIPVSTSSTSQITIRGVIIVSPTDLGFATPDEAYSAIIGTLSPAVDTGTMQEKLRALATEAGVTDLVAVEVVTQTFRATPYEMISDIPGRQGGDNHNGDDDGDGELSAGAIAGIVIAVVVTVSVAGFLVYHHHHQNQQKPFIASLEPGMTYGNPRLNSTPKDWQSKLNSWFEGNSDRAV